MSYNIVIFYFHAPLYSFLALIKNVVVEKNCYIAKNFIAKLCK